MLVAPLVWISDSPLLAYKVWSVLCLVANGLAAVLICRRLDYQPATRWVAGFGMILLPLSQQRIDVIQLVPVWGILWFFSCVFLLDRKPSRGRAIECGIAFATCFALCLHHSLFLSLIMVFACSVYLPRLRHRTYLSSSLIAVVVACVLVAPIVLPIWDATKEHGFVRSAKLIEKLSAYPHHYIASQDNAWLDPLNWVSDFKPEASVSRRFHIGWIRMIFAIAAVVIAFRTKQQRRWTLFLVLIGIAAFAFSLGPHLVVGGWKPWESVQRFVPGFQQVRNVFRFAWFVQLAVMLLAVSSFDSLLLAIDQRKRTANTSIPQKVMLAVFGLILAAEVWPEPTTAHYVPSAAKHRHWVNFVRSECPPGQPIVCLPMAFGDRLKDMEIETRWMLLGLGHGVPMLNGYSGFFPTSYQQVVDIVNTAGASDELFAELMKRRVGLIVVAEGFPITTAMKNFQSENFEVQQQFSDDVGVDIYSFRLKQ